ncbi:unnamed protein product [Brassica napus]|uniref:(rape) hypothetical protein n=1 Tax=Brassica napus TaxID=3708 RepID=A0A816JYX3_BRANA|nr:unnamed protein product [Brassica napus]
MHGSERIPTVKGPRTAVFWDAVDYPFPPSSTPDEIYHSISSALVERDFSDKITIWAYLDDDDKKGSALLGDRTWASRIYFLPGRDKASRRIRMINDINLWMRDSPQMSMSYEASLVLFSDQFKDDDVYYSDMLQQLGNRHYYVVLVTPALDINKPETPEWPVLLIDRGAYFFDESQIYRWDPFTLMYKLESLSPKEHEAEEETPEKLATYRIYRLETITPNMNKLKSSEWPGRQIDGGTSGWGISEEPFLKKHKSRCGRRNI